LTGIYKDKSRLYPSNQFSWNTEDGGVDSVAVHEFGHMLGNPDEYGEVGPIRWTHKGGKVREYKGILFRGAPKKDFGPPNQPGGNVMNNPKGPAESHHFWYVAEKAPHQKSVLGKCEVKKINERCPTNN